MIVSAAEPQSDPRGLELGGTIREEMTGREIGAIGNDGFDKDSGRRGGPNGASATLRLVTSWKRRFGCFSRAHMIAASISGGTSGRSADSDGVLSATMAAAVAVIDP